MTYVTSHILLRTLCFCKGIQSGENAMVKKKRLWTFSSVQLLSPVRLFATPWTAAHQASLSIINCQSLPKPMSIELVMPTNHLILCRTLFLLPSIFPSIRVFPMSQLFTSGVQSIGVSALASVLPMNTQDWSPLGLDLLAVQGTLKSLLQHHSSKASILQHSAFFIVQLSHPYMTTGKTIALTRRTFVIDCLNTGASQMAPW